MVEATQYSNLEKSGRNEVGGGTSRRGGQLGSWRCSITQQTRTGVDQERPGSERQKWNEARLMKFYLHPAETIIDEERADLDVWDRITIKTASVRHHPADQDWRGRRKIRFIKTVEGLPADQEEKQYDVRAQSLKTGISLTSRSGGQLGQRICGHRLDQTSSITGQRGSQ